MGKKSKPSKSSKKRIDKDEQNKSNVLLPGWPGYRTREGRSGYDPLDTRAEAGHSAGTILQTLFAGQIRNPFRLLLLGGLGLVLILPLLLAISEMLNGTQFSWNAWIFLLLIGLVGLAILLNFFKNLIRFVFNRK